MHLLLFPEALAFRQSVTVFKAYLVTILKALLKTTKGLLCLDEHSANYITCYSYFSSSWFPKLALPKLKQGNIFLLFATYLNGKLIKFYGFMYVFNLVYYYLTNCGKFSIQNAKYRLENQFNQLMFITKKVKNKNGLRLRWRKYSSLNTN